MAQDTPLVDKEYLLQKYPGKGGWTYVALPEVLQNKQNPFGWVIVRGQIDGYELKQYKLMPMGEGRLFLPVKAAIRKAIGKTAGDHVHVVLYPDESAVTLPAEIRECFALEPPASLETFTRFTPGEQKAYLDWIYATKSEDTRAERILKMMDRLQRQLKFYDKEA